MGQAPLMAEAPKRIFPATKLGYAVGIAEVPGGIACTQWLTTLTGESPTSSRRTHAAGRATRFDKAQPKRLADAAARRRSTRTDSLWGWQLFRSSGDGRERKTQRKEAPRPSDHEDS
jgi:hypothetical protein